MASKTSSAAAVPEFSQLPAPLLVDIRTAARTLGISVFAVRNLCWHRETARLLRPVRHGLKFLFSPTALTDFAAKLVEGEVQFPATPAKAKPRKHSA
jgi:hypothetical protein